MKQGKSTKVTQLKNDYTQSKTVEAYRDDKQKRTLKRRVAGIMVLATVLIISLGMNIFNNTRQLAQMDDEKVASAEELKQVEKTQENLDAEIKKTGRRRIHSQISTQSVLFDERRRNRIQLPRRQRI